MPRALAAEEAAEEAEEGAAEARAAEAPLDARQRRQRGRILRPLPRPGVQISSTLWRTGKMGEHVQAKIGASGFSLILVIKTKFIYES